MECPEYQVVTTPRGLFLPVESLLFQLHQVYEVQRSIFSVLGDLALLVPLHGTVSKPILTKGLLVAEAEQRGFRLNTLLRTDNKLVAEIVWAPSDQTYRFHVCLCSFPDGSPEPGTWVEPGMIGISQLLRGALRHMIPGPPASLLSAAGSSILKAHSLDLGAPQPH